jgi:predicted aspartyl protease
MHIKTRIINGEKSVEIKALIDSGAQGNFMDEQFAKKTSDPDCKTQKEIRVSNIDESPNKSGPIRFETRLLTKIDGKTISTRYLISDIGKEDIILGLPWLERVNPKVDWIKKSIKIIPKRMNPLTLRQGID